MLDIIKTLLEHPVLAVLIIPEVLKQLRKWHLGYLDRKSNTKDWNYVWSLKAPPYTYIIQHYLEVIKHDGTNVFIAVYIKPTIVPLYRKKNTFLLFR